MSVKRSCAALLTLAMTVSLLVGAPAVAQEVGTADEVDHAASEMFDKRLLEDDIGEPMTIDVDASGRVFMTDRLGTLRIHDQATGETTVAAEFDTYTEHYPLGSNEGGLLGATLDPGFEENGWIYVYYSDPDPDAWHVNLSRFEVDGDELDMSSEIVMLEVESQRLNCCHMGGQIKFDAAGDLYLSLGDETSPFESDQYAPIDIREGRETFDALRTAGNSADLRGSILRITPEDDGTYSIPDGNLFPEDEYDPEVARPEIYVMGARNPFRMAIDEQTGWLYYGMYGPAATSWSEARGPVGFDQFHQVREASNQGWPFCTGDNYAYTPWDFDEGAPIAGLEPFDCDGGPVNHSPNNTGLEQLPPVEPAFIYYPIEWNMYPFEVPEHFDNLGTGAGGPNGGPIYRYDEDLDSDTKFPEHFDGHWFILDWHRNWLKTVELDDGDIAGIHDFMDDTDWLAPHDAMFGPDGSLYVLEYGGGYFNAAENNGLYRVDWVGEDDGEDPPPPEECLVETVDHFDGDDLDRDVWSRIVREDPDGYTVADGALRLQTAVGDMIREFTDAPNLILQPLPSEGSWQATTEMTLDPTDPWQQAGLIVYGDDENFIKAPLAYGGQNRHLEFILQSNGVARATNSDWIVVPDDVPDTVQLRITSDGSEAVGEYSVDGDTWSSFGRPASLAGIEDPHIGFFAARGPDEGPSTEASFDWFSLAVGEEGRGPNDDFDGDELDRCIWPRIVREDPDGYAVSDGSLILPTAVGDMIRDTTTSPNLILQPLPNAAWQATTEMTIDPSDPWQQAGLIVYDDDGNFIKAPLAYGGDEQRRLEFLLHVDGEARATEDDWDVVPDDAPETIQLRLTSDGATVGAEYSIDGEDWSGFGRPASLANMDDPHIGFFAARGPDEGPVTDAAFHWFTLDTDAQPGPECGEPVIEDGYRPLWDGASLDGWSMAGPGTFDIVEDVDRDGTCALETIDGMGLLWHEEEFESYRVRMDFKAEAEDDNSGVFVGFPDPGDDPWVAVDEGYEIQIDDTGGFAGAGEEYMTGSIYTFQGPTSFPTVAGEWNSLEIEVDDPMIRVWINDELVNEYESVGTGRDLSSGHIGLQNNRPIDTVYFRDIQVTEPSDEPECGEPVIEDGYQALWDGVTLDGWNQAGPGGFDVVADEDREGTCALESIGDPEGLGMLWHEDELESYRLRMDFKAEAEDDNSGVFVGFPDPGDDPWVGVNEGYEINIDDTGGFAGAGPEHMTGSIYTFQGPTSFPTVAGEWNSLEIEVDDPMIRVWINDELVNEYESSGTGRDLSSGYIGLQNNRVSDTVFFRDVQVLELDEPDPTVEVELDPAEPDGEEGWYVSPVALSLSADPDEADLRWRYTDDEGWNAYDGPVVFEEDGTYAVEYQATIGDDAAHEPSETDVAVGAGGAWTFDPDEFTVTEGDTIVYELVDGFHNVVTVDETGEEVATSGAPSTNWDTYEFVADEVGTFYIYCTPHAGTAVSDPADYTGMVGRFDVEPAPTPQRASEIGEVEFRIDSTPPETAAELDGDQDGDVYAGEVTVTLEASDETSGVATTQYRVGDDAYEVYDEPITVADDGQHTIEFRSVDVAGNVEEWRSVTFTIDTFEDPEPPTAPTTKDDCKDGGWQQFTEPSFRNQGLCVAWVATGGGGGPGNGGGPPHGRG